MLLDIIYGKRDNRCGYTRRGYVYIYQAHIVWVDNRWCHTRRGYVYIYQAQIVWGDNRTGNIYMLPSFHKFKTK